MRDDQASGLRTIGAPAPVQAIAITGGKGGVGKTSVAVNLGMTMAMAGKRVMLLDADLGLANVDVLLGLSPRFNLAHLLAGECALEDLVLEAPHGLKVVPATSGKRHMASLGEREHAGLIRAFGDYHEPVDVLLVDTAAGISDSVLTFSRAAREVVVVVCDEPASITDAYALVKVLSRDFGIGRFKIVANMVSDAAHGRELYRKVTRVTERFLDANLHFMGSVPADDNVRRAIRRQSAVVDAWPGSPASLAFKKLAGAADKWGVPTGAGGHLEFFVERLVAPPAAEIAL
jgi:flagellar biosynthesis protein FlhG